MKTLSSFLSLALLLPAVFAAPSALADDKAACLDAASKGQKLRDGHKLVEAREQLRICAAAQCPNVVQTDCASWLAEVDRALPGVVIVAKNAAGGFVVDVKVTVDGQPFLAKLDGRALPVNAGMHSFHFEGADGTSVDQQVLVREGDKNQPVNVVLGAVPPPPPQGAGAGSSSAAGSTPCERELGSESSGSALRTAGWVLGGAGVVGLRGVGAVFGIVALGDKNGAHCDANNVCDPGSTSGIKSAALISDIGWIAGGVLVATGAGLLLFAPSGNHASTTGVRLSPVVTASGGELVLGGAW